MPSHTSPSKNSVAIQFVGSKTWLFFSNEDYIAQDGFGAVSMLCYLKEIKKN
jgi:hypothetical protein